MVGCWRGYLSGARCRLAYGSADATATHCLLLQYNPDWFTFLVPAHPGRLTRVVAEKGPLNGCECVCSERELCFFGGGDKWHKFFNGSDATSQ